MDARRTIRVPRARWVALEGRGERVRVRRTSPTRAEVMVVTRRYAVDWVPELGLLCPDAACRRDLGADEVGAVLRAVWPVFLGQADVRA